ncbi:MAG: DUF1553 domain-containing protein [Acidobacteria bacterium]|nr:DUF1553 domain-containing protein [Acidobacteriota bacterium]
MKICAVAGLLVLAQLAHAQAPGLRIYPARATLWGANTSQRFLALARDAEGVERDVTENALWIIADATKATIDASGKLMVRAAGPVTLRAEFDGLRAESVIRIEAVDAQRPFSFGTDIGGIFTRRGCNNSDCHGGVKGKAGYKLSANALFPQDDYTWTVEGGTFDVLSAETKGARVSRIDKLDPEKSLLLAKAAGQVAHGGGRRFAAGSPDYVTILNWVKAGAPFGAESGDKGVFIRSIEVYPREVVLRAGSSHRLLVTAQLSNGRTEDLTDQVLFVSGDSTVVEASEGGLLRGKQTGETSIMIRAAGHAVSARAGVIGSPVSNYPAFPARNYIDEHVAAKLRKFRIVPAALSGDAEFLRRVSLDLTGTLPPPDRVREFLADRSPNKRAALIETLLETPEFVDYWGFRLGDMLRATFVTSNSTAGLKAFEDWILTSLMANKPFDQLAMERIAGQGRSAPARNFYYVSEKVAPENLMPELIRVFMGRRIDCAQCHNHPFETWSQNQFWGLTAFFGGLTEVRNGQLIVDTMGDHPDRPRDMSVIHPRTKEKVLPTFLDGTVLPRERWTDPRRELAQWVVSHPYFAEAAANRIWGYFFGRGIVDPVDDFRGTNPPTHPELLAALAKDFQTHRFDLKHLMRTIAQSRTYQLSSVANETNRHDRINYSRAQPRPLDAAVLLDAISAATGVPEEFRYHPMANGDPAAGTRAQQMLPDLCPSPFMDAYGRSMRKTPGPGAPQPALSQALHMFAGTTYNSKLSKPDGRLAQLLARGADDGEAVDELYLAALTRLPTAAEKQSVMQALAQQRGGRAASLGNLLWALVSSREFAHNH